MTMSLAAVFIPVLFMGGIVGRLFHEFAVTIGVAILVSGFVSLTLTPMLVQPLPARRATARATACCTARPSACSTRMLRSTTAACAGRCATARSTMLVSLLDRSSPPSCCSSASRRASSRARTRPDLRRHRGRAGHLVRGDGRGTSRRSPTMLSHDPNVEAFMSFVGARRPGGAQHRHPLRPPQAARAAQRSLPTR